MTDLVHSEWVPRRILPLFHVIDAALTQCGYGEMSDELADLLSRDALLLAALQRMAFRVIAVPPQTARLNTEK